MSPTHVSAFGYIGGRHFRLKLHGRVTMNTENLSSKRSTAYWNFPRVVPVVVFFVFCFALRGVVNSLESPTRQAISGIIVKCGKSACILPVSNSVADYRSALAGTCHEETSQRSYGFQDETVMHCSVVEMGGESVAFFGSPKNEGNFRSCILVVERMTNVGGSSMWDLTARVKLSDGCDKFLLSPVAQQNYRKRAN